MPNYPTTPTQISPLRGYVALVTCPTLLQGTIQSYYDCFLSTKFKIYSLLGSFHSQASHCCWISAILRPCFTSTYIAQWVGHSDRGPNSYFGIRKRRNFKIWEKLFPNYKKQHNIMWSRFVCLIIVTRYCKPCPAQADKRALLSVEQAAQVASLPTDCSHLVQLEPSRHLHLPSSILVL